LQEHQLAWAQPQRCEVEVSQLRGGPYRARKYIVQGKSGALEKCSGIYFCQYF
jgi:hypothetical protein